ncbi:hypothetical protein CCR75_000307 [Bremia lactucae]|uniref:Uncharacterized protein n=1 Tax=Bremia lactucae TaxID=4779 RepID=A0A976FKW9_BRELC|nr:hypothetical protein CCR75_000307 [Bremia lactucae]
MGRRTREGSDSSDRVEGRSRKHAKLLRDGHDSDGDCWRWRTLLEKLHFLLDNELEGSVLNWLHDGSQFVVKHTGEIKLAKLLGLQVCSLDQVLEALHFECRVEDHWNCTIYRHWCFVRGHPHKIDRIAGYNSLSPEWGFVMPNIAYNSELKPLEVRLSLLGSTEQAWEVTIAPTVLPQPTLDVTEDFFFQENVTFCSAVEEVSWKKEFDSSDDCSDHNMKSPLWWSQRSDFSSICTDDLSEMDSLSQISAFYG